MTDPVAGLTEMARVTRPGGVVAACVWDHGGGQGPLGRYWEAARALDPGVDDESDLAGVRAGQLAELFASAGLREIEATSLDVSVEHPTFDDWWEPFTLGVGPAGAHAASLDPVRQAELRERCRDRLSDRAVRRDRASLGGARPGLTPDRGPDLRPDRGRGLDD